MRRFSLEARARLSERMRAAWRDPERRRRMLEGIQASRSAQSIIRCRQWSDPKYRERMLSRRGPKGVPPALLDDYRTLCRKRYRRAEALAVLGIAP